MSAATVLSLVSQGLWSGLTFFVALAVARHVPIEQFGWFAVGAALKQMILMVLGAIVLTPLTVVNGRRNSRSQRTCTGRRAVITVIQRVSVPCLLLAYLAGWLCDQPLGEFSLFVIGGLAAELQRRINFLDDKPIADFFGGLANAAVIAIMFWWLRANNAFGVPMAFFAVGITNLLWTGISNARLWFVLSTKIDVSALAELWRMGRWGLASNIAGYVYSYSTTFITLYLIGARGVAILELARQAVNIVLVFAQGMANLWHPRLARSLVVDDMRIFVSHVWRLTYLQAVLSGLALSIILASMPLLLLWLVPARHEEYGLVIPAARILAIALFLQLMWQHFSFALVALGKPEYGFLTRLVTATLVLPLAYILTSMWGVTGAAWARVIGEAVVAFIAITFFYRAARIRELATQVGHPTER